MEIKRIEGEFTEVLTCLKGENSKTPGYATYFPVIESIADAAKFTYLDSIEVKVTPSKSGNRFIVHPTFKDEDKALIEQVKTSLDAALNLIPMGREKLPGAFEIQVFFNSKLGIYSGNSFGGLLAILIFFEINKLLKPNILQQIVPSLAFTGAVDASGEIKSVGKKNIVRKVRSVFFSSVSRFVLPKEDETLASSLITKLQEKWPQRKLEIIGINNISEIFNRRDVINISRRPIKDRIKEGVKKYKYASLVLIPMILFLGFLSAREFDTNPVSFELDKTNLKILNKYGVVLWSWGFTEKTEFLSSPWRMKCLLRIIDVDSDGDNEVVVASIFPRLPSVQDDDMALLCFDSEYEIKWNIQLSDTVSSPKESGIPSAYTVKMVDTTTLQGRKVIICVANSVPTFPNAVFACDLKTGERLPGTVWNAGQFQQTGLVNLDSDLTPEFLAIADDNGQQIKKIIAIKLPLQDCMLPTVNEYVLHTKKVVEPVFEILAPVTDVSKMIGENRDFYTFGSIQLNQQKSAVFISQITPFVKHDACRVTLNLENLEVDIFIEGGFKSFRDSLVNAGKLPLPYTDTKEYTDILKNGVRYKLNGKWVTYAEYKKAKKL